MQRPNDAKYIARQLEIAKLYGSDVTKPGKYRKRSFMDCGKTKCNICGNPRKVHKSITIQELRMKEALPYEYMEAFVPN